MHRVENAQAVATHLFLHVAVFVDRRQHPALVITIVAIGGDQEVLVLSQPQLEVSELRLTRLQLLLAKRPLTVKLLLPIVFH